MEIRANYYDGKSSTKYNVRIAFHRTKIQITGLDGVIEYKIADIQISPRLGNSTRYLYLPGEAKCETLENDKIDTYLQSIKHKKSISIYKLENRISYMLIIAICAIVMVFFLIQSGIPYIAMIASNSIPLKTEQAIGNSGLKELDKMVFTPTLLDYGVQKNITLSFDTLIKTHANPAALQIIFRKSEKIGANAFALPSGIIVLTDDLVQLASNKNEIIAVLAHENGHSANKHPLRSILQNSIMFLLSTLIVGDVSSISSISILLPNLLLEAGYSRKFEREADKFAVELLQANNISPNHLIDILTRIEETEERKQTISYLSTHPSVSERIELINDNN